MFDVVVIDPIWTRLVYVCNGWELLFVFWCSFVGEGMHDDGTMVFAYYKEGATDPTFIYIAYGLKEVKCWRNPHQFSIYHPLLFTFLPFFFFLLF